MMYSMVVCWILAGLLHFCNGACYFSPELQGEYVMQNTVGSRGISQLSAPEVQYSNLEVTENAIPIWGTCHRRIGNNVILVINSGGTSCFRCFHLKLRSRNVLQVLTAGKEYLYKCDTNEETAIKTCPSANSTRQHDPNSEIILFKTQNYGGAFIKKVYCPIYGHYTFTYNINDGSESNVECKGTTSNLNSCPSGSTLNLNFRQCSFENYEMKLECLGYWDGPNNQTYLALVGSENWKPHYQCAIFNKDPVTDVIHMALSNDSTCTSGLHNSTHGFQTMTLTPVKENDWPQQVYYSSCRFPDWMKGTWQHLSLDETNTLIYKDHSSFKTYRIKCVGTVGLGASEDKYLVFGRTQCGEEMYNCLWINKRSTNVLEFQLGNNFSTTYDIDLCSDLNFKNSTWITQGRLSKNEESPCPIAGEYAGFIPDTTGLCAKLSSNCLYPEIMHYEVTDCHNHEVYEEREYSCLGQWQENGLVYTYTQRQDVAADTYECFVGFIISENEIYIKEAGDHCQRDVDPLKFGMKLTKQISCFNVETSSVTIAPPVTETTTKQWAPVTYVPSITIENSSCNIKFCNFSLFVMVASILIKHCI